MFKDSIYTLKQDFTKVFSRLTLRRRKNENIRDKNPEQAKLVKKVCKNATKKLCKNRQKTQQKVVKLCTKLFANPTWNLILAILGVAKLSCIDSNANLLSMIALN